MKTVESKSTFTLGYQFDALLRIAGLKRPKQADNAILYQQFVSNSIPFISKSGYRSMTRTLMREAGRICLEFAFPHIPWTTGPLLLICTTEALLLTPRLSSTRQ